MRYLEVKNNENITSINDTDTCLYLKNKVRVTTYFTSGATGYQNYGAALDSGKAYALAYDVTALKAPFDWYVNVSIPILDRKEGEAYLYVISSKQEVMITNLYEEKIGGFVVTVRFGCHKNDNIQQILEGITIYVYSTKIPNDGNVGMQVFDHDKNIVFNSNKYCLRIIDVVNRIYHSGVEYKKEEFTVPKRQYNTELIGSTLVRTTTMHGNTNVFQIVHIGEKTIEVVPERYRKEGFSNKRTNYLNLFVCDLSNTQDFPVDVNGHI